MNYQQPTTRVGEEAGDEQPTGPLQQLGAVPGRVTDEETLPGLRNIELEDGLEFASSGEAAEAPRFGNDDYDLELSPEYIEELRQADTTAREAANVLGVGLAEGIEREGPGEGTGVGREEAHIGSNPAYPGSQTPAITAQTPGHICSNPAERAVEDDLD